MATHCPEQKEYRHRVPCVSERGVRSHYKCDRVCVCAGAGAQRVRVGAQEWGQDHLDNVRGNDLRDSRLASERAQQQRGHAMGGGTSAKGRDGSVLPFSAHWSQHRGRRRCLVTSQVVFTHTRVRTLAGFTTPCPALTHTPQAVSCQRQDGDRRKGMQVCVCVCVWVCVCV